ncbi:mandelate racemase/muconate lactonizing enzyme family protein [Aurantimonas sp. 22II-16-19i]|uniref:mandelate racemase/muconate lactonizing enzyme family protein n=1 Tax=Aurantimonas sp. 22II-16-19i TaxID=1317114 RepID=UPI0009F7AB1C|nr:mandelate racemase/muconate lactonizing enzyme family protein [Aurantimonas sp. 22II-16-19i]ORE97832.1 Mandelate racemase/muconate lactonizing protein [Aurantimonas sp. 22II-16-19i]
MSSHAFSITHVEPLVFRVPIETPVVTSFGVMRDRPALFVRVVGTDGAEGWGEVWCNFPAVGAEHRARLITSVLAPLVTGRAFDEPAAAFAQLSEATAVLAIQSGEPGPLAQAIAGIDIALWDMLARRADEPLHRFLGGPDVNRVKAYASGLNADAPETLASQKAAAGYRRFKIKVGFGEEQDRRNLDAMRETFGDDTDLMVDANQAWDAETAIRMGRLFEPLRPRWLEEPVRADTPIDTWRSVAAGCGVPLANGENLRGAASFAAMAASGAVRYLQPDIGKWGGISGCLPVARNALANDVVYCPHWLGGGVGLIGSLHLLAAVGGEGLLEVDANPNPLREELMTGFPPVIDGDMLVPQGAGLGVAPDLAALKRYAVPLPA